MCDELDEVRRSPAKLDEVYQAGHCLAESVEHSSSNMVRTVGTGQRLVK